MRHEASKRYAILVEEIPKVKSKVKLMSNCKRFILLGDAGAGKSSFINLLYNTFYGTTKTDEIFCEHPRVRLSIPCANWLDCLDKTYKNKHSERDINDQTQSQTRACTNYIFQKDDIRLEIIDTPGFNDTNAFKEQQVAEVSIEAAQHTMQSNKQRDKQLEINAIRWVEAPQYQSPSASAQLNQKFTRDTFLKDQPKTFESTDRQLHKSKTSDQNQEKHPSFSSNCDRLSTKNHASIDIERKRSQQSTHGSRFYSEYDNEKQSSSQSTSSRKTNNEQLSKAIDSSRGSTFHSTTASDGFQYAKGTAEKYRKDNLSSSSVNHNKQHDSCLALSPMKVSDCSHSYEISHNTPTYRQEQTKIQVTIPDNEARFYHDSAQRQESSLSDRKQDLICQQRTLAHSLKSLRDNLKKEVTHLRSINKNYDLVERNRELLLAFKEVMQVLGGDPQMQHYYDDTLNILSNK
ncbi:hypothetical protein I4U23_004525 [Adineta vaga]|nr:hypothetical protein I4U23_004525 [Adineta vaga]